MIKIIKCSCESQYQDSKYGSGNRVANYATKKECYRCSVCRKEVK